MPIRSPSNNNILPANARASDVASKTINEVLKTQQSRFMSALRVQGYQGILYNRVKQGIKCTCQSASKALNLRLDVNGKASPAAINKLITGDDAFDILPYGSRASPVDNIFDTETSTQAPTNKHQGVFNVGAKDVSTYGKAEVIDVTPGFFDNGPMSEINIDDLAGDFDAANVGYSDSACAICFGTGFVGGYVPFNTYRCVYPVNHTAVSLGASEIDVADKPWSAITQAPVTVNVVFPRGACGVDSFKVYNGKTAVPVNFTVETSPIKHSVELLKYCDGKPHLVTLTFLKPEAVWTHFEVQFAVSSDSPYFEFPKLSQGSDTNLLDKTDPFQIIVGPNVPNLQVEDIIVDSTFGKALLVQNCNWWNTRNRNNLGWECTVRVIQPQEMYSILPKRGRILTKSPTLETAHPNKPGNRA